MACAHHARASRDGAPRRRPLPLLLLLVAVHGSGDPCAKILVNDDMTYMYAVNDDPANTQMKTNCYWVARRPCTGAHAVRLPLASTRKRRVRQPDAQLRGSRDAA